MAGQGRGMPWRWQMGPRTANAIATLVAATIVFDALRGAPPSTEAAYAPIAVALLIGELLTVRLRPGGRTTSMVLVPAIVAHTRYGSAVLPALAWVSLASALVRQANGTVALRRTGVEVLAYAVAHVLSLAVPADDLLMGGAVFAAAFAVVQTLVTSAVSRAGFLPPTGHDQRHGTAGDDQRHGTANPPLDWRQLLFALLLAPLAALPTAAWERLGDGALLLVLAMLLSLLFVVRESTNLVTARAEAEAERERLARGNQLQHDLIHLITHEVKNPLTSILAYSQLGLKAAETHRLDKLTGYLNQIERGGQMIQRLVDSLLQLSRIEDPFELPPSEAVDLAQLVPGLVEDFEPLAQQKNQRLTVDLADGLGPAWAPPGLLHDALANLVSNAIKYTPEQGEITLWTRAGPETSHLILGVTDTGLGMSAADQAKLFTKFFRSEDPSARKERGTGLGLALTHAIIQRMGGTIEVESELGRGTTFRLVVPVARSHAEG